MGNDTCDSCIYCTHKIEDGFGTYFYCSIDEEYVEGRFALNKEISCDAYVKDLDDNETKKSKA